NDLCLACYPEARSSRDIKHQHRVVVAGAVRRVLEDDPDWLTLRSWTRGAMLIFYNGASLPSTVLAGHMVKHGAYRPNSELQEKTRHTLEGPDEWALKERGQAERAVCKHIAMRDTRIPK